MSNLKNEEAKPGFKQEILVEFAAYRKALASLFSRQRKEAEKSVELLENVVKTLKSLMEENSVMTLALEEIAFGEEPGYPGSLATAKQLRQIAKICLENSKNA